MNSNVKKHTLESVYNKAKDEYVKRNRPDWAWEDEGKVYCVQDYHSMMGEFTDEDREFAKKVGIEDIVSFVENDLE